LKKEKEQEKPKAEFAKLKDLYANMAGANIKVEVVSVDKPIEVFSQKTMHTVPLQNIRVTDASIKPKTLWMVLWGPNIGQFKKGDKLSVKGIYTKMFGKDLQIRMRMDSEVEKIG
jgi:ssDNA-binding replication factor A large subunit